MQMSWSIKEKMHGPLYWISYHIGLCFWSQKNPDLFRFHIGVLQCGHMYPTLLTLFDTNLKIKMEEYKYKFKKPRKLNNNKRQKSFKWYRQIKFKFILYVT